jgi:hypothetical protein
MLNFVRTLAVLSLVALAALSAWSPAHAAVLIALELPQLVEQSDQIVVGNAQSQSSRYAEGVIVTDVLVRVVTALKGSSRPGDTLVVTHLGGSVDNVALSVPGAAGFKLGQSAIVFLRRAQSSQELNVTGMSQGVLPITGAGPAAVLDAGPGGATLMQRNANGAFVEAPQKSATHPKLSDTIAEIERLVGKR